MSLPSHHQIFLSQSGTRSQLLARELKALIDAVVHLNAWFAPEDIRGGDLWPSQLFKALQAARFGVICLTEENLFSPWIHMETGSVLLQKGTSDPVDATQDRESLFVVCLDPVPTQLPGILRLLQVRQISRATVLELMLRLQSQFGVDSENLIRERFDRHWPAFEEELRSSISAGPLVDVEKSAASLALALDGMRGAPVLTNPYMRRLLFVSTKDFAKRVNQVRNTPPVFRLPHMLYPAFLVELMKHCHANVQAIALVELEEHFWDLEHGNVIMQHTLNSSTRIFVFGSKDVMRRYIPMLRRHASAYNVMALSRARLKEDYSEFDRDFSIVGDMEHTLLATYDDEGIRKFIKFSTDVTNIADHRRAFQRMVGDATQIRSEKGDEELIDLTFTKPSSHARPKREMSIYISVDNYDAHEEKHAYFCEMMNTMLAKVRDLRASRDSAYRFRILEMGAGTGHFTKRLVVGLQNVDIVAVEIDEYCCRKLKSRMKSLEAEIERAGSTMQVINEDGITYDPVGRFDVVCSSFADHHIKLTDKELYFRNVIMNLKDGGRFLVGDEFLPPHDTGNPDERRRALHLYHEHIIDLARAAGEEELARLELDALQSGLQEIGDFKLTCSAYESKVVLAGLAFEKTLIGPAADLGVGGVYVYDMQVSP